MLEFSKQINFPFKLDEIEVFRNKHIIRAINAFKNPQLKSKLEKMPVLLKSNQIDKYMKLVLEAARTGDFNKIKVIKKVLKSSFKKNCKSSLR